MNTVSNCSHGAGSMSVSRVFFLFELILITADNIYRSQNVSSNRNGILTVTCSHSAETVEFRYRVSAREIWDYQITDIISCFLVL